jgi:1-acyl-sn-glycerol-3-phosphate acyltransferase
LTDFLSGAAYLAIRAQVPLVPLALDGVYDLLPIHTRHFYSGKLTLSVGEPIETTGMTPRQTDELTAQLRDAIQSLKLSSSANTQATVEHAEARA